MVWEEQVIKGKRLTGEVLEGEEFYDCEFRNCVVEECCLERCSFVRCVFADCRIISLQTRYSQVKNAELIRCSLIGVHWNELLPAGRVAEPITRISQCFLKYNSFLKERMICFDFSGNHLQECYFEECDLKESSFQGCRLEATQFIKCDLRKADFREAAGYQINLASNRLSEARFSFPEVVHLLDGLGIRID